MVDMQKLTHGVLHTKFWVVDQTHFYIGSANMDWRSLTQVCLYPVHLLFQATLSSTGHPASNCIPPQSQSPLYSVCNGFLPTYYQASLNDPKSSPTAFPLPMEAWGSLWCHSCQPLYRAFKALSTHLDFVLHSLNACSKPSPVLDDAGNTVVT